MINIIITADEIDNDHKKVGRFRRILPQVIATTVTNLLLLDLGFILAMPTIIIPALTGIPNVHNRLEILTITPHQSSWIGSIGYLFQPVGSLISTTFTDCVGRKNSMMLANVPMALGWFVACHADTFSLVLVACAILGLGVGMAAPNITYVGEICEPSTRGILMAYSSISSTCGMLIICILNTMMAWRMVCYICFTLPLITMIAICFIPKTPQWLLSKNRPMEAEKSLQWLRGWTTSTAVADEFHRLRHHSELSKSCNLCIKTQTKCIHPKPNLSQKYSELKRRRTIKPFVIVMMLFLIAQFSGIYSMRTFMVQIFNAYDTPIPADRIIAVMSCIDSLANVVFMCVVRLTGKRRIYLTTIAGIFLCASLLSGYSLVYLPNGYHSFNQKTFRMDNQQLTYIPMMCLLLWSLFSSFGFLAMPWMLLSEIFPFKSRGIASGIAAALNYIFGFISRKMYYNLETTLSLAGVSVFYSIICGSGFVLMYFILPETENRTLEDIERHFSNNAKIITDRKIAKIVVIEDIKRKIDKDIWSYENNGFDTERRY